ncbi:hypothetical protein Shyd_45700 [Streptomyces hydrogenans]|uniref:Uncharacterized protein n=1 Tax=Streptomyces hydrogenans TaxID=1873719 RepID=A0ABQ3PDT5_9ACTN|nr:hypothetical protein GCM10018784_68660 [Streptomyces hydrogenans]GHI23199.1 hypothetical protein Shyd_45700 [Streptomyces hydrogenans]
MPAAAIVAALSYYVVQLFFGRRAAPPGSAGGPGVVPRGMEYHRAGGGYRRGAEPLRGAAVLRPAGVEERGRARLPWGSRALSSCGGTAMQHRRRGCPAPCARWAGGDVVAPGRDARAGRPGYPKRPEM